MEESRVKAKLKKSGRKKKRRKEKKNNFPNADTLSTAKKNLSAMENAIDQLIVIYLPKIRSYTPEKNTEEAKKKLNTFATNRKRFVSDRKHNVQRTRFECVTIILWAVIKSKTINKRVCFFTKKR
jgi:hypothetical protein